jgi:hypothetical protein
MLAGALKTDMTTDAFFPLRNAPPAGVGAHVPAAMSSATQSTRTYVYMLTLAFAWMRGYVLPAATACWPHSPSTAVMFSKKESTFRKARLGTLAF